jgi:hypothetical protein
MRGLGRVFKGAVFIGAVVQSSIAVAAAGDVKTVVTKLADPVTYSRDIGDTKKELLTYVGYQFDVSNKSGNTINKVTVEATASVADLDEKLILSSVDAPSSVRCTVPQPNFQNKLVVSCDLGQMKSPDERTFTLFFIAPAQDANVLSQTDPDYVDMRGRTITAEGSNGGNSTNNSIDYWPVGGDTCPGPSLEFPLTTTDHTCIKVALGTPNSENVSSAVQKIGGTFFTGIGGVPGYLFKDPESTTGFSPDPFTTTVKVRSSATTLKANALETESVCGSAYLKKCHKSDISVQDVANNTAVFTSANYLTFILRIDGSAVQTGTKIGSIGVYYTGVKLPVPPETVGDPVVKELVPPCSSATTPRSNGLPCIAATRYYNTVKKGEDPLLKGSYEWTLISLKNGFLEFE